MNETSALQKIEPMPPVAVNPTVEAMITLAVERGASVDTIERLMAVRREVRQEQAKEAFDRALAEFQDECPVIPKNKVVKNRDNSVRYRYADLEQIKASIGPILRKHGFSYRFTTKTLESRMVTTCLVTHIAGHTEPSEFEVPIEKSGRMNSVQESGSSSTYAKRYALSNGLGIITSDEDNDGNTTGLPPKGDNDKVSSGTKPSAPTPKPKEPAKPAAATEDQRVRWVKQLKSIEDKAVAYGYAEGILLPPGDNFPGEPLECWPLNATPSTKRQAVELFARIKGFQTPAQGGFDHEEPQNASETAQQAPKDGLSGPETHEDGIETITGKLEAISIKEGRSKKGPWTRYGLKVAGEWLNTFNRLLGEIAEKDKGHTVTVHFKREERGNELVGIERAKKD